MCATMNVTKQKILHGFKDVFYVQIFKAEQ
jgi:hypothetical protein